MGERNDLRREREDERAKLYVLTRYKTRYNGQRETKNEKTGHSERKEIVP